MFNLKEIVLECVKKYKSFEKVIPIEKHLFRISEIEDISNNPTFWSDANRAKSLMKERQGLLDITNKLSWFKSDLDFYSEIIESAPEELEQLGSNIFTLQKNINDFEFSLIFTDKLDGSPAIISINSGAGGLEAANWVSMLLRMYSRYAMNKGFEVEILDLQPSEEHSSICIDSVSLRISGPYAYGYLKSESGVHRLIRNSPFSSSDTRHTSCAAVNVSADIEDIIEIVLVDKEYEITAQRAGGAGGQNVNMRDSAARIKHFPTGINILVRAERDFHSNKKTAIKMLKAKLYDLEVKKKQAENDKILANLNDISFGAQIRTYTFQPYRLVKDERTDHESNKFDDVLDGNIEGFILSYLKARSNV